MESLQPPNSPGESVSRRHSTRGRPPLPQGPRIRNRPSQGFDLTITSPTGSTMQELPFSPNSPLAADLSLPSPSYQELQPLVLPSIAEVQRPRSTYEKSIQAPSTPPPPRPASAEPSVKVIPKPATLTPPPKINFDSIPIAWKGLPLEAAQWTLSSEQLQEIVSRAIRLSARESFIRILSISAMESDIPTESERLDTLKATTQAKYRFHVQRRTMLLQGLNSLATAPGSDKDKDAGASIVANFTSQLSATTAACDRLMEELLHISDQQAQIGQLLSVHWASALAIALRKLNGSYGRRTSDLKAAKQRIVSLEAELEEAWNEAEKMAQEIDDLDGPPGGHSDDDGEGYTDMSLGNVMGVSGTGVATKATVVDEAVTDQEPEAQLPMSPANANDAATIRSTRSMRSTRSTDQGSRWNRVSNAKKRSIRVSNASLRLPRRTPSKSRPQPSNEIHAPPVPDLPDTMQQGKSFLDFGNRQKHNRPTDDIGTLRNEHDIPGYYDDQPHPFSATFNDAAIPPIWTDTELPPKPPGGDRVQSMQPLMRRDTARRSSSEFTMNHKDNSKRNSVPLPPYEPRADSSKNSVATA